MVIDTLVYGWIVVMAFKPTRPYALRAGSLVLPVAWRIVTGLGVSLELHSEPGM